MLKGVLQIQENKISWIFPRVSHDTLILLLFFFLSTGALSDLDLPFADSSSPQIF